MPTIWSDQHHSWLYYLLLLLLGLGGTFSAGIGGLYFFKRSGVKLGNYCYGLLLIGIGLTQLHIILVLTGFYERFPQLKFLPIYFTLTLPSLLFFYVKLNLYPAYRLRWTDSKHFLLGFFQWIFFWIVFLQPTARKLDTDRYFYNPFYGGLEQALFLSLFVAYMYFAYRYLKQRERQLKRTTLPRKMWYLRKLIKGLFLLFAVHAIFVLGDFFSYEFLRINLRTVPIYAGLGALSFAALVYWLSLYGFQILFWGRKVFRW